MELVLISLSLVPVFTAIITVEEYLNWEESYREIAEEQKKL